MTTPNEVDLKTRLHRKLVEDLELAASYYIEHNFCKSSSSLAAGPVLCEKCKKIGAFIGVLLNSIMIHFVENSDRIGHVFPIPSRLYSIGSVVKEAFFEEIGRQPTENRKKLLLLQERKDD